MSAAAVFLLALCAGSTAAFGQDRVALPVAQNYDLSAQTAIATVRPTPTTPGQLRSVQEVLRATMDGQTVPMPPALPRVAVPLLAPHDGPVLTMQGVPAMIPPMPGSVPGSIYVPGTALAALVDANSDGVLDEEANCLATAVYFESKGEPLEGQLAVAQVVINRAHSGRFPATMCGVIKQHKQFSFVRAGAFPYVNQGCAAWRKAQAIARIATRNLVAALPADVLWYHADYVAPRWRSALFKVQQIGAHIFYRA